MNRFVSYAATLFFMMGVINIVSSCHKKDYEIEIPVTPDPGNNNGDNNGNNKGSDEENDSRISNLLLTGWKKDTSNGYIQYIFHSDNTVEYIVSVNRNKVSKTLKYTFVTSKMELTIQEEGRRTTYEIQELTEDVLVFNNETYQNVGDWREEEFTPPVDPVVTSNPNVAAYVFNAIVSGSVTGVDEDVETGIIYDITDNLDEFHGEKAVTNSHDTFTLSLDNLYDEMTYYYRAFAYVKGVYYLGEILTFETKPFTYSINGRTFRMIQVEGGPMGNFSIMQTEYTPFQEADGKGKTNNKKDGRVDLNEFTEWMAEIYRQYPRFRLPTKEEFVYAASGGNKSKGFIYSGSNNINDVAWYSGNSGGKPHNVATKAPNELGIYDMSGNYGEYCQKTRDALGENGYNTVDMFAQMDTNAEYAVYYGGSYKDGANDCRILSTNTVLTSRNAIASPELLCIRFVMSRP